MTIDKAIEIGQQYTRDGDFLSRADFISFAKLGIEALKLIAQEPPEGYTCIPRPLPGETEE